MESNGRAKKATFNPKKFIIQCLKSWKIFLLSILVCTSLAYLYSKIKTPVVEVEAQLMLKDDSGSSSMMMLGELARSFSLGDMFGGSSSTDNEASIIRSYSVFLNTAKQLDLNTSYFEKRFGFKWIPMQLTSPIKLTAPEEMADTLRTGLTFNVKRQESGKYDVTVKIKRRKIGEVKDQALPFDVPTEYGTFTIDKSEEFDNPQNAKIDDIKIVYMSYAAAAEAYAKVVNVFVPDRKTDFIGLSVMAINPKFGEQLLNTIIQNYTKVGDDYKRDRSEQSLKLVNDRLTSLIDEMQTSESELERFKKQNNLTDVEVDAQYLLTKTGNIEATLLEAQTRCEVAKLTKDFINNPSNSYELIPDLFVSMGALTSGGETASNQIAQYNELILQRMNLLTTAKSSNAAVKQLDEQLNAMRKNIITSVDRAYENAKITLNDLKRENSLTQSKISKLPTLERQYIAIKRDNLLQQQMYLFLLQQREELNMSLASRSLPAQVIDAPHAIVTPMGLTPKLLLVIGAFFGFCLAVAWVILKKMKTASINETSELKQDLEAPLLTVLKPVKGNVVLTTDSDSPNAEELRNLRSEVQTALKSCDGNTVVVTSLHHGEGKTYVAVNLAAMLSKIGKRVLLVDASLRRPGVAVMLGVNPSATLAHYVASPVKTSGVDIKEVSIDDQSNIDVITADNTSANAADILASDAVRELFEQLKEQYEYVVIDASPIEGFSDMNYLTDMADVTLIVCRGGKTNANDVATINEYYDQGRYKRIGVVANGYK